MKSITIYLDDGKIVEISDNNNDPIEDYVNNLSSMMEETNVVILATSESSLIIRPTRINGINVEEEPEPNEDVSILKTIDFTESGPKDEEPIKEEIEKEEPEVTIEEEEDVITDA